MFFFFKDYIAFLGTVYVFEEDIYDNSFCIVFFVCFVCLVECSWLKHSGWIMLDGCDYVGLCGSEPLVEFL